MKFVLLLIFLVLPLSLAHATAAAAWVDGPKGAKLVRLENSFLQLDFDPQQGARGAALIDKATGKNWLFGYDSQEGAGLFMDHFWEQNWPGEFLRTPYQMEILPVENGAARVRFSITATGKWGQRPAPLLAGLQLTRIVTLMPDSPVIHVKVQVRNPTNEGKVMGYWMQNVLWAGGDRENDVYLRPNYRNVSRIAWDWKTKTPIVGFMESEFERAPTAGWTAVLDEKQNRGMVFLMDYGPLMFLYNCLQMTTVEWQYLQAGIPPGKTWETEVTAVLTDGFTNFTHATNEALFDVGFNTKPEALDITLRAGRLDQPIKSVKFDLKVLQLQSRKEVPLPVAEIKDLEFKPKEATVSMPGAFTEQIALKVDAHVTLANGNMKDEHFEVFFGGKLGFAGINRTIDLPPMYPLPSQPKKMNFLKPERIERIRQGTPQVLLVAGRESGAWRAADAIKAMKAEVKLSEFNEASSIAANVTYWPVDYNDLMKFDAVVLANLDGAALGVLGQEMLKDYVNHGGGLVVLGGMYTLGNGSFAGSRFAEVLPVEPGKPFEIRPLKESKLTVTGDAGFRGLDGKQARFAHLLTLRNNAKVMVKAGDAPILVTGESGQGRVAVLGATTIGTLPNNQTPFWKEESWPESLVAIIQWAAKR